MEIAALRGLLRPFIGDLKDSCTNATMPAYCQELGLPVPDDAPDKRGRMHAAFDAVPDRELPAFAQGLVEKRILDAALRNEVQDVLWADTPAVEVPKRSRRDLARALQRVDLFQHWENFAQLLRDVFVIQDDYFSRLYPGRGGPPGILGYVHQHFVRNPEDADVEALFEEMRVFDLSDRRFGVLLEGLVGADVQVDAETQQAVVAAISPVLLECGAEMRQTGEMGGYPVFSLIALRSPRGRAKNLIFASQKKPDIRFRDAVNNDIEIVSEQDDVLVYDRPIGAEGVRWRDLVAWWGETTGEPNPEQAKKGLYRRLRACLPDNSPPQRLLFKSFFEAFAARIPELPALLPEVWLHWDPKTVAQRGTQALLTHRMDFLMLLPGSRRIVIEVDGVQHYANEQGMADPHRYARMACAERELKLAGYEVYRFAGVELREPDGPGRIKAFFEALFERHGIRCR